MPKLTALIHAHGASDIPHLARALDSCQQCDDVLIINHGSDAEVDRVARGKGCRLKEAIPGVSPGAYLVDARHDWIFCLRPGEAFSEALQASLAEWDGQEHENCAFSVGIREQAANHWQVLPPETRLVNRKKVNWTGELPAPDSDAILLAGDLLRWT